MGLIIADCHCDSILDVAHGKRSLAEKSDFGHLDFPRLIEGQIALQFMALYIEEKYKPNGVLKRSLELIDLMLREVKLVDYLSIIRQKEDLENLSPNNPSILLSIEGGEAIDDSLGILRMYYNLGIRSMTLTWNYRNKIAFGCREASEHQGLSQFGQKVIQEMNNLGMLIDVSHLSEKSFWDVLDYTNAPLIVSHSCCRALANHSRNLNDQQMKAIAQNDGVLGINFYPHFLNLTPHASIDDVLRHLAYSCEIMGTNHVALGSDFDGIEVVPSGLENCVRLPELIVHLEKMGFSNLEIRNIMGYNVIELLKKVLK